MMFFKEGSKSQVLQLIFVVISEKLCKPLEKRAFTSENCLDKLFPMQPQSQAQLLSAVCRPFFFFLVHWSYLCHFHLLSTPIHASINYVLNCKCLLFNSCSVLDDKAGNLRFQSEVYKKDATYLNLRSSYAKYAAVGTVFLVLVIYVRFWWF